MSKRRFSAGLACALFFPMAVACANHQAVVSNGRPTSDRDVGAEAGRGKKKNGGEKLPKSWVNPPPDRETWKPKKSEYKTPASAPLISLGDDGKLVYKPFTDKGDKLYDYSQCGYKRSEEPIPDVPVVVTLSPPEGEAKPVDPMKYPVGPDGLKTIQDALDKVAGMKPDANGFKGAVLLKKGTWYLSAGLLVQDGVVLRGEGDGEDGTILLITLSKEAGLGGTGIQLGKGAGSARSFTLKLAGTVMKKEGKNLLKLEDGSIFPMRNKFGLPLKEGQKVILSFQGQILTQGGKREVSVRKTFPTKMEPWSAEKAPPLDPDLNLPGIIRPGAEQEKASAPALPRSKIVDDYVPTGASKITVADGSHFKVGDWIDIRKTTNKKWIDVLGVGERLRHIRGGKQGLGKRPWGPGNYGHLRRVKAVDGNTITLDIQMPQSIAKEHGGGYVEKKNPPSKDRNCGVEYLRIVSNYDKTQPENPGKGTNCRNLRTAVGVNAMDSWVRNVSALHIYNNAVSLGALFCTVRDSKYLKPIGPKRGGHRYCFSIGGGLGNLVYRCYAEDGRHDFVIGARMAGPHVFLECEVPEGGNAEPHHRWGVGVLWDNLNMPTGGGCTMNRGDSGSGHGWAGANSLFWNSNSSVMVYDPETEGENNFAIGYTGTRTEFGVGGLWYGNTRAGYWGTPREGKFYGYALMGSGHIESPDKPVEPRSLFKAQLIERIGKEKAEAVLK